MPLLDKAEPEKRTVGRYKATNGYKYFFVFFQAKLVTPLLSYANKSYIRLELPTFSLSQTTSIKFLTKLYHVKLSSCVGEDCLLHPPLKNFLPTCMVGPWF